MNGNSNNACEATGNTLIRNDLEPEKGITGVYGLRNRTTGKWYIGQSWDLANRWGHHRRLKCKRQPKIFNALAKYGVDDFEFVLLEQVVCPSQIALDRVERYWIKRYNSTEEGYNLQSGGSYGKHSVETRRRMLGHKKPNRTKEQRENMAAAQRGKIQSAESVEKRAAKMRGRKRPPRTVEWSRKIGEAAKLRYKNKNSHPLYGRSHSDETRRKISEALKSRTLTPP
jgi:group I intron endonuclease